MRPVRSNDEWLSALADPDHLGREAVAELEAYLVGALRRIIKARSGAVDLADLVQESMVQILASLGSFRGDSRFTTWATAIATRVAFTELRRRSVSRCPGAFEAVCREVEDMAGPAADGPEAVLSRGQLVGALQQAIADELTPRQRLAITAELRGIPTIEIAAQLRINQNALYKLTHDARKRLRAAVLARGYTVPAVREIVGEERT